MPEEMGAPFISILNTQVAMGPVMAEARVGAIHIRGFFTMLPICSMEVPRPWDTRPPTLFSLKEITAKPTICAQQPATAAPPARPVSSNAAQIAAEEMGSVRATPTITETRIPIRKGCSSVAHLMTLPTAMAALPRAGAISQDRSTPTPMVTRGVTRISILVSLETALPNSAAMMAIKRTASGPPAPPSVSAAKPTVVMEKSTSGGHCSA